MYAPDFDITLSTAGYASLLAGYNIATGCEVTFRFSQIFSI
jgi:hypothetical protein